MIWETIIHNQHIGAILMDAPAKIIVHSKQSGVSRKVQVIQQLGSEIKPRVQIGVMIKGDEL
jgi:hypothetical protein